MNSVVFYIVFILASFSIFAVAIKLFPKDSIFTIAIGAVIGSNIYNSVSYPIKIGGLIFGIDSIVYTIFVFCLLLMFINYGKKDFYALLYTSIFSIFFTAFLYFMGTFAVEGYSKPLLMTTLSYLNSIIGTYIAMIVTVFVYKKLIEKKVNVYVSILIGLLIASVINSFIYFSLTSLYTGTIRSDFLPSLAGSYIGKLIASCLCLLIYLLQKTNFKNKSNREAKVDYENRAVLESKDENLADKKKNNLN